MVVVWGLGAQTGSIIQTSLDHWTLMSQPVQCWANRPAPPTLSIAVVAYGWEYLKVNCSL